MDSRQLTAEQARELHSRLSGMLGYLNRLLRRMEQRGFPESDPLFRAGIQARNGLQDLCVKAHRLSCGDVWDGRHRN